MILGVWNEIVDDSERYLVYRMRSWMVWNGAQSTEWVVVSSFSNQVRTGSWNT
jgi:hypothetical protein